LFFFLEVPDHYVEDVENYPPESNFYYQFECDKLYNIHGSVSTRFPSYVGIGRNSWFTYSLQDNGEKQWTTGQGRESINDNNGTDVRPYIATIKFEYLDDGAKNVNLYLDPDPQSMIRGVITKDGVYINNCVSLKFKQFGVKTVDTSDIKLTIEAIYFEGNIDNN